MLLQYYRVIYTQVFNSLSCLIIVYFQPDNSELDMNLFMRPKQYL